MIVLIAIGVGENKSKKLPPLAAGPWSGGLDSLMFPGTTRLLKRATFFSSRSASSIRFWIRNQRIDSGVRLNVEWR